MSLPSICAILAFSILHRSSDSVHALGYVCMLSFWTGELHADWVVDSPGSKGLSSEAPASKYAGAHDCLTRPVNLRRVKLGAKVIIARLETNLRASGFKCQL